MLTATQSALYGSIPVWVGRAKPSGNQSCLNLEAPDCPQQLLDLLELILNNIYSGIIVCNRDTRIIFINQIYADLLKVDRNKVIGRKIHDFFPASRLGRVIESGRAELGQRCALKTEMPLLVNRIPLKFQGQTTGAILQTVFRDYKQFTDLVNRLSLLENEIKFYKKGLKSLLAAQYTFQSIIGQSEAITEARNLAEKYAQTDAPVLITGATGTGKELFAHAIHNASPRQFGPFVCINAAALPRELLESEMFGYTAGAFTGASAKGKAGKIELSHQGTLFLDEIGELPVGAQAKLLRVLETRVLDKIGSTSAVPVDFRLIAATNRDLPEQIARRRFRDDLYYRLNTMLVEVPTLAERRDDIPLLVDNYLQCLGRSELEPGPEVFRILNQYGWPGNIRELQNVIKRAVSLADGNRISIAHLPETLLSAKKPEIRLSGKPDTSLFGEMAAYEKALLESRLKECNHNMSQVARSLGVSRSTLYEKCRKYHLA
jgi:transcriptional regulator with PAS, ATPase and Fis domain